MQRDLKMSLINSLLALWTLWTTEPASKRCWMFIFSSCYHVIDIVVVNLLIASNTYVTKGWGHSGSLRGLLPKINWARIANRSGKVWKMFLSPLTLFLSPCSLFSPNMYLVQNAKCFYSDFIPPASLVTSARSLFTETSGWWTVGAIAKSTDWLLIQGGHWQSITSRVKCLAIISNRCESCGEVANPENGILRVGWRITINAGHRRCR